MRKLYLLLAWLSLSASALSQNLVAYYPFNGNANDQSGNAINPTYVGSGVTLTSDRFGNANKAYNFDGATNSYMRMPADLLPTTNRSISLWFNVPDVSNRPGLFGYGGNGSYGTTLLMGLNCTGTGQYWVQGHGGLNGIGYTYPTAPVNNWYHWVLTINGSEQKIYVNGELKSTANTFSGSTAVAGKDFALGVITSPSGSVPYTDVNVGYLNGKLDDVRIYDAAMSDAQVLNLYNSEVGMAAYYPFNGNANDETGNGNNSTYIGTGVTLTTDRFGNANKAYYFDGAVGSYIRIPADNFPATNRTISFWFNADDPAVYRTPFSYGGNGCSASCFLMILNQFGNGTYTKTGHCNYERIVVPYSTPPVNSWKQWVITINGSVQKIYIDGVLQTPSFDANFSTPTYVTGRSVLFGAMVNTDGNSVYEDGVLNFKGKLDEFRIYNNAMTDAQVAAEYSGMVAYYPFNGNANDESGKNHNGTVTEAVLTTDINGTANKAYQFDGVNDMITAPAHADWSFENGDFSITSLVNVSAIGTSRIVSAGYTASDGIWGLGFGNHPVWGSGIRINYFVHSGGDYHDYSSNEITGYSIGQWAFVGITKTGSTLTFYFNGQPAGTATIPYVSNANSYLSIGSRQLTSGTNIEFFNGKIDAVRIYNRSLTSVEILQLYNSETTGLVAYFPFNGNANDATGNNHNGTVSGATLTTDRSGNTNSAYIFNGSSDFIDINQASTLNLPEYTYSAWINPSAYPPVPSTGIILNIGGNMADQLLALHNSPPSIGFGGSGYYVGGGYYLLNTGSLPALNQWYQVAVTRSSTAYKLYVNGVLNQSMSLSAAGPDYANPIFGFIGKRIGDIMYFQGKIDDIRIYNRPLSPNEILQLADVPMMPDLVAYLPMNGNANDMSGNGHNGSVSGAVLTQDKYGSNNSAYDFPGTDNQIVLANSTGLGFQNSGFTLSAWVKYNNAYGHIIAKHTCYSGTGYVLEILNNQFTFLLDNSGTWTSVATNETFTNGKWYHVTAIYNGAGVASIYINGELKVTGTVGYNSTNTASIVISGASGTCPQINYHGSIDEVKIYGSPLSAAQVMALYKQSRGSGKAMKFDGVDDYVSLGTGWDANNFTFETWYQIASYAGSPIFISAKNNGGWLIRINNLKYIEIEKTGASSHSVGPIADADNKWHHLAITVNATTTTYYWDGLLVGSGSYSPGFNSGNGEYSLGGKIGYAFNWNAGTMDEVRIWNTALTQTQIQDWKNRKITPDHPAYANLVGYYNFNEPNIFLTYDNKGAKTGVLTNGPIYVSSGAAIGDASVHNFTNPAVAATLTLPTGENFSALQSAGTALGVSVYVVKDPPENQVGILGLGSNDHYFGVEKASDYTGGITASYNATYNYTGNPFVSPATEPTLQLFKRNDNSATPWINSGATLNTTANTLTVTGQNTEYILGSSGFGLPVSLLSFQAQKVNATTAKLNWQTATEINNKGFEIQRSFDGNYFVNVGFVNGAGNSDVLKEYSITDIPGKTGRVYYRLKQVDFDGNSKLSQIVSIVFDKQGLIKVYPNPAQQQVVIEGVDQYNRVQLLDATGKLIKEQLNNSQYLLTLNLEGVKSGMYLLRLINGNNNQTIKLMIEN